MTVNEIQEILDHFSEPQGWNDESEIIHLCGFIQSLSENADIPAGFDAALQFRMYLETIQKEENVGCDSVCEQCGQPAEYDPDYIICKKCKASVGLST